MFLFLYCSLVNLCLEGLKSGYGIEGSYGTVLLSNPVGASLVSFEGLVKEVILKLPYRISNRNNH
jgi:hypothetical protein